MKNNDVLQNILNASFPIMVISSAGSGKTYSLVAKINKIINVDKVKPDNILAITFTVDAANEMKSRIESDDVTIGTIHSIMFEIVRNCHPKSWYVCDDKTRQSIAFDICKENNIPFDAIPIFYNEIDFAKNKYVDYFQRLNNDELFESNLLLFAKKYEEIKQYRHKLDFADMLLYAHELLSTKPNVLNMYQEKYQYIFVDEVQDCSTLDVELISLIANKYNNIFIIGDVKQQIFSWKSS